jgi:hypothetical protein
MQKLANTLAKTQTVSGFSYKPNGGVCISKSKTENCDWNKKHWQYYLRNGNNYTAISS